MTSAIIVRLTQKIRTKSLIPSRQVFLGLQVNYERFIEGIIEKTLIAYHFVVIRSRLLDLFQGNKQKSQQIHPHQPLATELDV